jgi:phosphoribosylaminoimidazole-succinocarboxamide synthase
MSHEIRSQSAGQPILKRNKTVFYQGHGKAFFETNDPRTLIIRYQDESGDVPGLGSLQNRLNGRLYTQLGLVGIENHFVRVINMWEQVVFLAEPLPFHLHISNCAHGALAKRFGIDEGIAFNKPVFEWIIKGASDESSVASDHLIAVDWVDADDVKDVLTIAQRLNDFLNGQFFALGMRLGSYRIQFGYSMQDCWDPNRLVLIDSFDLKRCVVWDVETGIQLGIGGFEDGSDVEDRSGFHRMVSRFGIL